MLSSATAGILFFGVKNENDILPAPGVLCRWRSRFLDYLRRKRRRRAGRTWGRDEGARRFRYSYDLGPDSVVFDCGGYLGDFAAEIVQRYPCTVYSFEPVPAYFEQLSKRFNGTSRVVCLNYGLGARSRETRMSVEKDASSVFRPAGSAELETVQFVDLGEALQLAGGRRIDLLKLNIEGGEFELLEAVLERNLATHFRDIQVQFHQVIPDYHERRLRIRAGLAKTHHLTYDYYFVFENWRLGTA